MTTTLAPPTRRFFDYARERHSIYLKRSRGEPEPWTIDKILQHYRFTNVFRELDRTTIWFRENVRDPMRDDPDVLLATVLFRWFNRITTGEALFLQKDLITGGSAFEDSLPSGDTQRLRLAIKSYCGKGPYVTGAYTINTAGLGTGKTKLNGVLAQYESFAEDRDWRVHAEQMQVFAHSMEDFCRWLQDGTMGMGPFMAYEVACDLRWTSLLNRARDINTWASPGPGARRGAARIMDLGTRQSRGKDRPVFASVEETLDTMRDLLEVSRRDEFWPREWPAWEMREVEHTLCEWDKYERTRLGQGRPRGVFRP